MIKKILPDLIAILAFVLISFAYFFPADIEERILFQHDTAAGAGAGQEAKEYYEQTGERTRWTNSLFGGMPTYQIAPSYDSTAPLQWTQKVYQLFLPSYVNLTFILMLGFYILLRVFGIPVWLAGLGGIMWAFSSYFFILISAGHIWKFITLAYIPPTIAGIVLAYRGKLLAGGILTALFIALQIMSNHVQMSYYFLFVILFIVGAYFEDAWRNKTLPKFFKASAVVFVAALIGVAANLSNLYHTYTYSKETMRGKSELVETGDAAKQTSSGLDRDYITNWSYGIGETWTLLVPNFKGGSSSAPLSQSETAMEKANPVYSSLYNSFPQYFGDQPWTAGPVYVGSFVLFLFVLGCFIVKGPLKWALLGATFFSIVLAWGKNFMPLTDFFIDYIPMYNKFRAVSSILVIAEFTIPLLAIFALKHVLDEPGIWKKYINYIRQKTGANITYVNFRSKNKGWKNYHFNIKLNNGQIYDTPHQKNTYMRLFLKNIILRPSCYSCHYKGYKREADITLADFWGINNILPEMDDDTGTSLIYIHSKKGELIWSAVKQSVRYKATDVIAATKYNPSMLYSPKKPIVRKKFFAKVTDKNIRFLAAIYNYIALLERIIRRFIRH